MIQIKTVTTATTETEITFEKFNLHGAKDMIYIWVRNLGDENVYMSDKTGVEAEADGTTLIKAGDIGLVTTVLDNKIYAIGATKLECHAQLFAECPFKRVVKGGGGASPVIESLSVDQNGTYTAPTGVDGYSPVTVVLPLGTKSITQNGTYTASTDELEGYSSVTVDVQEQPWAPLQDGYSNFWFELDENTLSPWLNFSAKNNDAVIDWGDGSGEVALDTLTPTHTYSEAGKYVVKVKGVTGIGRLFVTSDVSSAYMQILTHIEFNSEVTTLATAAFRYCVNVDAIAGEENITTTNIYAFSYMPKLQSVKIGSGRSSIGGYEFMNDFSLSNINFGNITEIGVQSFYYCISLHSISIPSTIQTIGNTVFSGCAALREIHIAATVPPTIGTSVFNGLPSDWICYVPVGHGDIYKAADGWSSYADHIVEEGSQLTRAQLRKISEAEDNTNTEEEIER